jgi:predicted DNA-binding transcriptional regulator AlpA
MASENYINAREASALLGVHPTTFWARRKAGRYPEPVLMIGNRPVFDKAAILAAAERETANAH